MQKTTGKCRLRDQARPLIKAHIIPEPFWPIKEGTPKLLTNTAIIFPARVARWRWPAPARSRWSRPLRLKIRRIPRFKRARVKSLAKRIIAPGATVVTDGLGCFRGLADAGCTHIPITTGSGRKAARHPTFKWVKIGAEHSSPQTQGKACGNRFTRGAFGRAGHELAGLLMARSDFADTSSNASIARRKLALDWCADEAIRDKRLRFAALRPHSVLSILPKRLQGQPCGLGD